MNSADLQLDTMAFMLRTWRRNLLVAVEFSATIAIGMGSATALVSLMLALGYQPLPYHDPGKLVAVWERAESGTEVAAISGPDLVDFADATRSMFVSLGGFAIPRLWLVDRRGATEVRTCTIQASVFSDLGLRPVLGRPVRPGDELVGGAAAPAWISYQLWQARYGGSSSVINTTVGLSASATGADQSRMTIVGVLPANVSIPLPFMQENADVWYLLPPNIANRSRQSSVFFGVGRLRPGIGVSQAQAALAVVAQNLGQRYSFDRHKIPVIQKLEDIAHEPARRTMSLLVLGVGLVFVVGCINLAILMGAEGKNRRREIAIRAALGAGRWRLWRDVATEKSVLALLSLALGIGLGRALLGILARLVPAAGLGPPLAHVPSLNLMVLLCFAAFSLVAAEVWSGVLVLAADAQAWSRSLAASADGLGYTGFSDSSPGSGRWRLVLLSAQIGTGTCLLAAAVVTVNTYAKASVANLGHAPSQTMLLSISPQDNVVLTDAQAAEFNQQLLTRLQRLPGTQSIALADFFPPLGFPIPFTKLGDADAPDRSATWPVSVSSLYFRTLGIPILLGRGFDQTDNVHSEPVAVISMDMAERNWGSPEMAIGSHISFGPKSEYRVVGVVANFGGYWFQKPVPMVYLPEAQAGNWAGEVILRTSLSKPTIAELAPEVLSGMPIVATISNVSTMQERWQATLTRPMARMAGMLLLALLGLGLSVQGIYAVAAANVASRRHELAVRAALGADYGRLAWNVARELVIAIFVGAFLGLAAAIDLRHLLERWLGPMATWRAESIAGAMALLACAAAAGCFLPIRAAVKANPIDVLRGG